MFERWSSFLKFFSLDSTQGRFKKTLKSLSLFFGAFIVLSLSGCLQSKGVLNPGGLVAKKEKVLLFEALAIMLIVVIPVIVMSIAFAMRYRKHRHNKSKYRPEWSHSTLLEAFWWGVPTVIIIVLAIITWKTSHAYDPYRHISSKDEQSQIAHSSKKPLVIEAVSLRWKWLFIYPDQSIATVNTLTIPKDTPVEFKLTSEAPMTAFFIPRLASQVYVMAGMQTKLNLISDKIDTYEGKNAQYNGPGFGWNTFKVHVVSSKDFRQFITHTKSTHNVLSTQKYVKSIWSKLNDSKAFPEMTFSHVNVDLYHCIIQKYHLPLADNSPFSKQYYRNRLENNPELKNSCAFQLYNLEKKYPQMYDPKSQHRAH